MSQSVTVPKHLWIIGIVALLWNLMGAYDYVMTQTKNDSTLNPADAQTLTANSELTWAKTKQLNLTFGLDAFHRFKTSERW